MSVLSQNRTACMHCGAHQRFKHFLTLVGTCHLYGDPCSITRVVTYHFSVDPYDEAAEYVNTGFGEAIFCCIRGTTGTSGMGRAISSGRIVQVSGKVC